MQVDGLKLGTQHLSETAVISSLGRHLVPLPLDLGLLALKGSGQISNGGSNLRRPSWSRGTCTGKNGPSALLLQLQCHDPLDCIRVERGFRLKNFLASNVNALVCYQLRQQYGVKDTSRALSNGVANVGIDPTPNINLQALFNSIKEHCPLLGHLRSMQCGNKSATYKMVPDFHVLVEVLGWEMGVLIPDYVPPSTPSADFVTDFLHIGQVHQ